VRRPGVRVIVGVVVVLTIAACGSTLSPRPTLLTNPSLAPSSLPTASPDSSEPSALALASPIPVDVGLLDRLPASVDGLNRHTEASVDATIARDPGLAKIAVSFATALYADPATGEFAYVSLVRPTQALPAEAYRDYRDTFDEAACAQAGGRSGTATATFGGHKVEIGSCAGGVLTYHALLEDGVILAVSALGERRLGEKVVLSLDNPGPS
jgi:hypothetical protein